MNAQTAFKIAKENKPSIIDAKYKFIMQSVEEAIKLGRTDFCLGDTMPCSELRDKLEKQGYWIYYIGGGFMPKMYGVSWDEKKPKKKLYVIVYDLIKKLFK